VTPALDGLFVASYYQNSILPHAIHTLKYRFIPDLALPLGTFLTETLEKSALPLPDALIPVPLHRRRLRFRGFNQSALLAEVVSQTLAPGLEIPLLATTLLRTRFTKPQMKTDSREERLTNLKNAFALAPGTEVAIAGKTLWLIDDVATTGTTLTECATVLKQHGARFVFGIVLAR
jgi:ComF family protein